MDLQVLFNITIGALGAVLGWVVRTLWSASERVRVDLQQLERGLPNTYVRRDDFQTYAEANRREHVEIKVLLQNIADKLDRKADR